MGKSNPKSTASADASVEEHGYEFGGPIGAFVLTFGLPVLLYSFTFFCNDISGCPAPSLLNPSTISLSTLKQEIGWPANGIVGLFDARVTLYVAGYYALILLLQILLPGTEAEGVELACGGKHKYKFNALLVAIVVLAGCASGSVIYGAEFPVWKFIWDNYVQILTANILFSYMIAIFVFFRSFGVPKTGQPNPDSRELAPAGRSSNLIYGFFLGRELNPRIKLPIPFVSEVSRTVDIKVFCELRPGLLGWVILDLANAAHQYKINAGQITLSMYLAAIFQTFYVLDSYYNEPALLTTMDVIMDGFGFMLSFGDLAWVPFLYSIQTRYLAIYPLDLGVWGFALVMAVQGLGYYIFRSANNQKNRFRTNPNDPEVKHLKYIQTASGSKLITSGWWGVARHINYLGDWIMSWSYCLPTGVAGYLIINEINPSSGELEKRAVQTPEVRGWGMIVTYFFMLYFAILLVHRERRDEAKCKRKYGADWAKYTSVVRSRILPGIY